jgi:hypothetical protein
MRRWPWYRMSRPLVGALTSLGPSARRAPPGLFLFRLGGQTARRRCRSARYSVVLLVPVRPSFYFARV